MLMGVPVVLDPMTIDNNRFATNWAGNLNIKGNNFFSFGIHLVVVVAQD